MGSYCLALLFDKARAKNKKNVDTVLKKKVEDRSSPKIAQRSYPFLG